MTVANHMLSLRGSLQPDPFSAEHAPKSVIPSANESKRYEVEVESMTIHVPELEEDSELEEDAFDFVNEIRRKAEELAAADEERKKEEKAKRKEEKKRKRAEKEGKGAGGGDEVEGVESTELKVKKKRKKDKGESQRTQ